MTNGNGEGIRCVEELRIEVFPKQVADHVRYLIFGGIAVARNGLLDAPGSVLNNGDIARECRGHHHALRPTQFQHRLHVFSKKGVFNRHLVGVVLVNEPQDGFVKFLELQLVGAIFAQLNHTVLNHTHHAPFYRDNAITGNLRAGIHAQNNFLLGNGGSNRCNNHEYGVGLFLQSNVFSAVLSLLTNKKIVFWAKLTVLVALLAYIGYVLRAQPLNWRMVHAQLQFVAHPEIWAAGLLLLTPVNWGLEALKWWILLQRVEQTSFAEALRGVLAGAALGFALPAQLGDTAGRVLSLRTSQRGSAIGASLVSGGMQFYVALVFGTVAWAHHLSVTPVRNNGAGQWLLGVLSVLSVGGIAFGLVRRQLITWLTTRRQLTRFAAYWNVAGLYADQELALALLVAALRYGVFAGQFYLAMRLVGITMQPAIAASGIGLVFLVKTITPAFNLLSDLGVREAASLWVFGPLSLPAPVLITATLLLWAVNILSPVLAGLFWVWKLKLTAE